MSRITSKNRNRYVGKTSTGWKKLQQLEDVEEELGVDLITLFKALKNGMFVKNKYDKIIEVVDYDSFALMFDLNEEQLVFVMEEGFKEENDLIHHYCYPKDYGKTWALTREELKNDN